MILNFNEFIFESNKTMDVVDLLFSIARNYSSTNIFYNPENFHFYIKKEHRKWKNLRETAKLEQTLKAECEYLGEFELDKKNCKIHVNFDLYYRGQNEKDAPEPNHESAMRLSVVLNQLKVKYLKIDSQYVNYESSKINSKIKKALINFLIKILKDDYDSLSSFMYKIEQE